MKKSGVLVVAFVALSAMCFAQEVTFGVKGGLNVANQKFKVEGGSLSPDARVGFHIGGFATIMFSDQFGLQPELMFTTAGSNFKLLDEKIVQKFNYLAVPVLFRYQPIEILNFHAGPQIGFLLGAEAEVGDISGDVEDAKSLDFGAAFGAGVDLPGGLGFNARYIAGLANVYDIDEMKVRNNVLQLSVTYRFGGSK